MIRIDAREYAEEMDVSIGQLSEEETIRGVRWVIVASDGIHDRTKVDLVDVLSHIQEYMPDLWEAIGEKK